MRDPNQGLCTGRCICLRHARTERMLRRLMSALRRSVSFLKIRKVQGLVTRCGAGRVAKSFAQRCGDHCG
jgi:hypothetical protein